MIDKGFVKIDKELKIDYSNNDIRVYMHLLMAANYTDNVVYDRPIKVGQCITSYGSVANALGISVGGVIAAVKHLTKARLIEWQGVRDKYSVCTICDYVDKYKDIKYNFVMLNRVITAANWYKHEGAAKIYYYLLLHIPLGNNSITIKPVYLRQMLGLGHSQYSNGVAKLVDDKKITCTKVSRQIQLTLADLASPASSVASPVASLPTSAEKKVADNKTSSDTQYYF